MKKVLPVLLSLLISICILGYDFFMSDRKKATIQVVDTPRLACNITIDDLLDNVRVDDEDLKTVFIEENNMMDISETGKVTYVAIDNSNNITKLKVNVEYEEDFKKMHIEAINPLQANVNNNINPSDYFALVNECGFKKTGIFNISGVDFGINGEYSAIVSSKKDICDDLNVLFTIKKAGAPTIHLTDYIYYAGTNERFSDYYFNNLIDDIYDDNDDYLSPNINWRDELVKNDDGYYNEGRYTVTYDVMDSDGNIGKSTLMLIIDKDYDIEIPVYVYEENIEGVSVNGQ